MKFRRSTASLAIVLSGALMLGACTSPDATETPDTTADTPAATTEDTATTDDATDEATEPTDETTADEAGDEGDDATVADSCLQDVGITETQDGEVRFTAGPGDWSGYNATTSRTYSTYNSAVADQMFSGFVYFGTDGTICDDTEYGTYEVTSEDPLEIKYTISDEATWSDGTPITINDYLLDWAAQNPEFLSPGYASGENPDAEAVFDHVSASFAQYVPEGPQGEVGSKEFTVTYNEPYPDFRLVIGGTLPAHVVAQQSGLEPDALAQAILDRDADTVSSAAEFWNNGWMYNPGELPADFSTVPSSGPYKLMEGGWTAGQYITLEANPDYWGTPAGTQNLVFRFIEDAGQVQALTNGDVQAVEPQATVDTLGQIEAIGDAVTVDTISSLTWEHLDFNFRDTNVFSDAQGGQALREAFAHCVPRQQIVDSLIKDINPDAVVMNAREVFPFQDDYQEVVDAAYDGRYDEVDIEAAQAKIAEAGVETPVPVRIGYRAGNERRTDIVAAIAASCGEAGFEVEDVNSADFFEAALPNGDYEVALFAWSGSGQIASGQNIYASNRPQNYGEYSNADVDAAWAKLAGTLDEATQLEATKEIESLLWETLYGIPLFAHPRVVAYDSNLQNVRPTTTQDGISWNAAQWQNA